MHPRPLTLHARAVASGVIAVALFGLVGCRGQTPAPAPYVLHIQSGAVITAAVDMIEIVFHAHMPNRFVNVPMQTEAGGDAQSFVDAAGEWVLRLNRHWVQQHAMPSMSTFAVDVALYSTGTDGGVDPSIMDPEVIVDFIRCRPSRGCVTDPATMGERMAEGRRFSQWPLVSGRQDTVLVMCKSMPTNYSFQCTNTDPVDGGMPPGDAAMPPGDAGTPPPMDAGTPPPMDAGTPPPMDAGTPPPMDAGTPPPMDAGTPPPMDAGTPTDAAMPGDG